jgi:hypothetical protein
MPSPLELSFLFSTNPGLIHFSLKLPSWNPFFTQESRQYLFVGCTILWTWTNCAVIKYWFSCGGGWWLWCLSSFTRDTFLCSHELCFFLCSNYIVLLGLTCGNALFVNLYFWNLHWPSNLVHRTSRSEFVVSVNKYLEAKNHKMSVGMRFKMRFEGDESPERRYSPFLHSINSYFVIDFRGVPIITFFLNCLQIQWDNYWSRKHAS